MEDADIHVCDIGDGNAIFGIFDGHGGTLYFKVQGTKSVSMSNRFLLKHSKVCLLIKQKITKTLLWTVSESSTKRFSVK